MDEFQRFLEHVFIIPLRWYRVHINNWFELRQRCKVCGNCDKFDFHVPDELWKEVIPKKYQNRVVCLACFDDFAKKKGIKYKDALSELCFAGDVHCFEFEIK